MKKDPFVITLSEKDLPNIVSSTDENGFEYSKTNIWQDDNIDIIRLLNLLNEKIDIIIGLLK